MSKNRKLNYIKTGNGKTVVLIHGLLSSHNYWKNATTLLENDYEVLALDLLGFGDSDKPSDAQYSVDEQVASVFRTLKAAEITMPIILVGHSMGALIAIRFAANYPTLVEKVILCNTPLFGGKDAREDRLYNSSIAPKILMKGRIAQLICHSSRHLPFMEGILRYYPHKLPGYVKVDLMKHTWESYSRSMTNLIEVYDPLNDLEIIKNKTIALIGGSDQVVNRSTVGAILPTGIQQIVLDGADHHIPIFNTKELIVAIKEST